MRFNANYINYPVNEDDKPVRNFDGNNEYEIDKKLLYDELATRPHRVRAKDRRKKKMA